MTQTMRRRARGRAGQTLIVFALLAMILFGVIGLAVDAGVGYLTAATADRAASAAVLAGVVDMPSFGLAQSHAVSVAQSNGIAASHVTVKQDCTLPGGVCYPNRLEVTVTETAPTSFLALFGFGNSTVTKTQEAEYRSPIGLGQAGASLGADDTNFGLTSGSNPTFYMPQMEGWNVARQQGDAFTPNPTSSYSSGTAATHLDEHVMNGEKGTDTTPGISYGGGPSYLARGGYNYLLYVPAGQVAQLQVYNPIFSPDQPSTWTASAGGVEPIKEGLYLDCAGSPPGTMVGAACNSDWTHSAAEYASMRYTIFSTASPYDQTHDSPLSSVVANPIDAWNGPAGPGGTAAWNAASNSYVNIVTGATCSAPCPQPTGYRQWVSVGDPNLGTDSSGLYHTNPGGGAPTLTGNAGGSYYRLRVDMLTTDGQDPSVGSNGALQQALKYYSLRMVDPSAPNDTDGPVTPPQQCAGCQVQAMNDFAFFSEVDGTLSPNPSMQVLNIPADYAGQSVNVDLFDPGDLQVETLPVIPATVASLGIDSNTIHTGQAPEFNLSVLNAGDSSPVCPDPNSKATLSYSTSPGGPFTVLTGGLNMAYCANIWSNNSGHFISGIHGPGGSCGPGPDPSLGVWCPGTYYIQATYSGDAAYQASTSNTITLTVDNNNSTCHVDQGDFGPTPVVPGTDIHITGNVLDNGNGSDLTGYINVYDVTSGPPSAGNLMTSLGTMPHSLNLPNNWSFGFYGVDTSSWSPGPHNIEVDYPPQGNYPAGCSTIFAFSAVSSLPTGTTPTVTVNANPGSVTQGNTVTLSANASTGGSPDTSGAFYFSVDGVNSGTAYPDGSGNGSVTISTNGLSASASPGTVHNVSVDYYASGSDTYATTTFNVVISSSGGGGGGGSAYHGGYHVRPLPNYVRGGAGSAQPQFVLMSARKTTPPACSCYVDISFLQPDNTLATVSAVTVLGPSETGTAGCVDPTVPPNLPDVPASCPTLPASQPVPALDPYARPLYNGEWLQFTIQVPASYTGGYWSLKYSVGGAIITEDALTITTNIASSPVHLLPQPN